MAALPAVMGGGAPESAPHALPGPRACLGGTGTLADMELDSRSGLPQNPSSSGTGRADAGTQVGWRDVLAASSRRLPWPGQLLAGAAAAAPPCGCRAAAAGASDAEAVRLQARALSAVPTAGCTVRLSLA